MVFKKDWQSRLKSALFSSPNKENFSLPKMTYDKNGNILNLSRKANIAGGFGTVDSLNYFYSGNRLLKVEDVITDTSKNYFNNRNTVGNDFDYYSNGNLKKDLNENINQINYNTYLNQPIEVQKPDGTWEKSFFDGSGHLFKRTNSLGTTWTYLGNIIYKNDTLYQIGTPEGRIIQDTLGNYSYQFEYRDLTGNLRLLYQDPTIGNPSVRMAPEIVQSQDYEPFGIGFNEYFGSKTKNRFGYSNHEIINDLGLNRIDFGARIYNPTYGRFDKIDRYSTKYPSLSSYHYTANNPMRFIDVNGDSLRIQTSDNTYAYYSNGNLSNSNGSQYNGPGVKMKKDGSIKLKGNLKRTVNDLNSISEGGEAGSNLISAIVSSNQTATINYSESGNSATRLNIQFNPNLTEGGLDNKGLNSRPSFIGLAHELAHVFDYINNTLNMNKWFTASNGKDIPRAEIFGSNFENLIRKENNLNLRAYYTQNAVDEARLIDSNNLPIYSIYSIRTPNLINRPNPLTQIKLN